LPVLAFLLSSLITYPSSFLEIQLQRWRIRSDPLIWLEWKKGNRRENRRGTGGKEWVREREQEGGKKEEEGKGEGQRTKYLLVYPN
jgi:hypothetical protein